MRPAGRSAIELPPTAGRWPRLSNGNRNTRANTVARGRSVRTTRTSRTSRSIPAHQGLRTVYDAGGGTGSTGGGGSTGNTTSPQFGIGGAIEGYPGVYSPNSPGAVDVINGVGTWKDIISGKAIDPTLFPGVKDLFGFGRRQRLSRAQAADCRWSGSSAPSGRRTRRRYRQGSRHGRHRA